MTTKLNGIEMPATDLIAAKQFYEANFGWTFTDYGPGYSTKADGATAPSKLPKGGPPPMASANLTRYADTHSMIYEVEVVGPTQ